MIKTIFIINPVAGKGKGGKSLSAIKNYISENSIDADIVLTEKPKHATEIASKLSAEEFGRVICVGGDGTLNEIINGIDLTKTLEIGILPIGSGNDFATAVKMGKNMLPNLELLCAPVPKTQKVDIGHIEYSDFGGNGFVKNSRFINSLGFGFDAYVAYLNQTNKNLRGISSYIVAVFKALRNFEAAEIDFVIDSKNKISGKKLLVAIGNSQTTGGGFYLTPDAEIDDGKFNICTIKNISKAKLLVSLPKALINKLKSVPEVSLFDFYDLQVSVKNEGFFVHCDGENISKNIQSAKISILKHNLKFITK